MARVSVSVRPFDPLRFTKRVVPAAERHQWIAEAAYFLALARHFAPDHDLEDWLSAEREADKQFVVRPEPIPHA